jgi:hypothetical protein
MFCKDGSYDWAERILSFNTNHHIVCFYFIYFHRKLLIDSDVNNQQNLDMVFKTYRNVEYFKLKVTSDI